ncbi:hypothetical protein T492DRAFT_928055, partial [Pavlovales sp. CCMP2436]
MALRACFQAALGGAATAAGAYVLSSSVPPHQMRKEDLVETAVFGAVGGGSALALTGSWFGVVPRLIPTHQYPLRAYALRSVVLYTVVLPPVLAAVVGTSLLLEGLALERLPEAFPTALGSTWIIGAGCQTAYHLYVETSTPRTRVSLAVIAGLLQWGVILGSIRQLWDAVDLERRDLSGRTSMSRWRANAPDQNETNVGAAMRER